MGFFCALADFVEKLRQLDSSDPLELFQRCYTALELYSEREQEKERRPQWSAWLNAWLTFLEFYRACAACVLWAVPPSAGTFSPEAPGSGGRLSMTAGASSDGVRDRNEGNSPESRPSGATAANVRSVAGAEEPAAIAL